MRDRRRTLQRTACPQPPGDGGDRQALKEDQPSAQDKCPGRSSATIRRLSFVGCQMSRRCRDDQPPMTESQIANEAQETRFSRKNLVSVRLQSPHGRTGCAEMIKSQMATEERSSTGLESGIWSLGFESLDPANRKKPGFVAALKEKTWFPCTRTCPCKPARGAKGDLTFRAIGAILMALVQRLR